MRISFCSVSNAVKLHIQFKRVLPEQDSVTLPLILLRPWMITEVPSVAGVAYHVDCHGRFFATRARALSTRTRGRLISGLLFE